MKILVKFPSRGRPKQLIASLSRAIALAENNRDIVYQLTLDTNDAFTNNDEFDGVIESLRKHANIDVFRGSSAGKIHACNRDMSVANPGWEIVLLLSDDMICQKESWDQILRQEMDVHYPDTDGVLWHNDGYTGDKLNTLCILGRKYFNRFNYIYHPEYKSLWCDNEFMEVANKLGRQTYFPLVLFKHEHPANTTNASNDELYRINEGYFREDERVFRKRKLANFGL